MTVICYDQSKLHQCIDWCEPGSSVSIATGYRLSDQGSVADGDGGFSSTLCVQPALGPTETLTEGTRDLSRVVLLTPHPLLVPWVKKERGYTSTPPLWKYCCTMGNLLNDIEGGLILHCVVLVQNSSVHNSERINSVLNQIMFIFIHPSEWE
jgi:hypothetical protein